MSKRISEVKAICELLGMNEFKIVHTAGNHLRIESSTELTSPVVTSNTPSDIRSNKNLRSIIRKNLTVEMLEKLMKLKTERRGGGRKRISPEIKARVLKRVLAGEKVLIVSEEEGVGKSTVAAWKAEALNPTPPHAVKGFKKPKIKKAPVSDSKSSLIQPMRLPEDCKKTSEVGAMELSQAIRILQDTADLMMEKEAQIKHLMQVNEQVRAERDEAVTKLALIKETIGMK